METYQAIQDRLTQRTVAPVRKDLREVFPLRNVVACECGGSMSANYSKSRTGKLHAYYFCFNRACEHYKRSVRQADIESAFEQMLKQLQPSRELFDLASLLFRDWWNSMSSISKSRRKSLEGELQKVDHAMSQLLDRIVDADSPAVIKAYENRISQYEESRALYAEKIAACGRPVASFDKVFPTALRFLASPCNLWETGKIEDRRAVMKLCFAERPRYSWNNGFQPPLTSSPFKVLSALEGGETACPVTLGALRAHEAEPKTHDGLSTARCT